MHTLCQSAPSLPLAPVPPFLPAPPLSSDLVSPIAAPPLGTGDGRNLNNIALLDGRNLNNIARVLGPTGAARVTLGMV